MSLKTRMLGSVFIVMALVCALLTANLVVDGFARRRAQLNDKAEFLKNLVGDWIRKDRLQAPDWPSLDARLSTSTLVTDWLVVEEGRDGKLVVRTGNGTERDLFAEDEKLFKSVLAENRIEVRGSRVYAPLVTEAGIFAGRFDLKGRDTGGFDLTRSVWTILVLMALGTLLLVLATYMLLHRMILRPLQGIIDASRRIAEGDFSRKIPEHPQGDELASMVNAINLMMEKIEAYHLTLKEDIKRAREKISHTEKILVHAQRLSTTGTLAAGIAHEINNPLGGMINATNMLKSGRLDAAKQAEYIDLVGDGLERIKSIVQKILQFRPKAVQAIPVSMRETVDKASAFIEHKTKGRQVTVTNDVPADLAPVHGDPLELQQAILNVLMNAVDACESGKGRVGVTAAVTGGRIQISISDNGMGMDEEELARCVDPFYTTKDQGVGTGLGLPVAVSIVENHQGRLNLASRKGEGTTVILDFPAVPQPVPASRSL